MDFWFDDFDLGLDDSDCCGNCYSCIYAEWKDGDVAWCLKED